jgi:hypothetical protein
MPWSFEPGEWSDQYKQEFIQWGRPDNRLLGWPVLSRELFQRTVPHYIYRSLVSGVADFTRGAAHYVVFNKLQNAYIERWAHNVGEFDDFPDIRLGWARSSIRVDERGIGIKLTERERLFSRENVEQITRNYLSTIVARNIDVDILENAVLWTDIVFIKQASSLKKIRGKAIGDTRTRTAPRTGTLPDGTDNNAGKLFFEDSINIPAEDIAGFNRYSFVVPIIFANDYDSVGTISYDDLLEVKEEFTRRRMVGRVNYVILNTKAYNTLHRDPFFRQYAAFAGTPVETGELPALAGFKFVIDNSGELERVLSVLNSTLVHNYTTDENGRPINGTPTDGSLDHKKFGSIVIFVGEEGYKEAVAMPEAVDTESKHFGRYTRILARTYRNEQPMYFYADPYFNIDPTTGRTYDELGWEDRKISSGIILLGA